ncbi:hypothetical protein HPP92_018912 [Vanilla planifolia]|uniref:Uncharacterized protein n=1 Tax=Vanilla planifolia TaxID=51239 RepID=A0A835UMP6_VANPL|nr:hypothetical protein HPP92_018912 [Vanilla planifolia]
MNTHLKTLKGNNIRYFILLDSLNLKTLLVEETPGVKPKKPTAGSKDMLRDLLRNVRFVEMAVIKAIIMGYRSS